MLPSRTDIYETFLLWPDQVETIIGFVLRSGAGPRWLDAGCGTGRLLPALTAAGMHVVGIDADGEYLDRARLRAPGVCVRKADLRDLTSDLGLFDGIVVCNGPLSYVLSDRDLDSILIGLAARLRPGGVLITDTPNFPWIVDHYQTPPVQRSRWRGLEIERRPRHVIAPPRFTHIDTLITSRNGVELDRRVESHTFAMRQADQIIEAHQKAGLLTVQRWPSWDATCPSSVPGPRVLLTAVRAAD